jgi:UDP-glucose 4-epimerase
LFDRLRTDAGPLKVMGSGQESRDFLGEQSVASALLELAQLKATMPPTKEPLIVNVASGVEVTTLQMAQHLAALIRPGREIVCCGEPRPGDPLRWCADVSRLHRLLPAFRSQSLTESLANAIADWRQHPSSRA